MIGDIVVEASNLHSALECRRYESPGPKDDRFEAAGSMEKIILRALNYEEPALSSTIWNCH